MVLTFGELMLEILIVNQRSITMGGEMERVMACMYSFSRNKVSLVLHPCLLNEGNVKLHKEYSRKETICRNDISNLVQSTSGTDFLGNSCTKENYIHLGRVKACITQEVSSIGDCAG
jgi:hypothetical protein